MDLTFIRYRPAKKVLPGLQQIEIKNVPEQSLRHVFYFFIMDFSLLTTSGVSQKRNEAVGNTKPPAMRVEDKLLYKKITFPL